MIVCSLVSSSEYECCRWSPIGGSSSRRWEWRQICRSRRRRASNRHTLTTNNQIFFNSPLRDILFVCDVIFQISMIVVTCTLHNNRYFSLLEHVQSIVQKVVVEQSPIFVSVLYKVSLVARQPHWAGWEDYCFLLLFYYDPL